MDEEKQNVPKDLGSYHRAPSDMECESCKRPLRTGDLCRIFDVEPEKFGGKVRVFVCPKCSESWGQQKFENVSMGTSSKMVAKVGLKKLLRAAYEEQPELFGKDFMDFITQVMDPVAKKLGVKSLRKMANLLVLEFEDGSKEEYSEQEILVCDWWTKEDGDA